MCLVHAFIGSKGDYCYRLIYGLPNSATSKLQRVQNAAARLVNGSPRFCDIKPVLESLDWLPNKYRIHFMIVLLTFKCIYGLVPQYLVKLTSMNTNSKYSLTSSDSLSLTPPSGKRLATLGDSLIDHSSWLLQNSVTEYLQISVALTRFCPSKQH